MTCISKRKYAVLATDGVEHAELTEPVKALRDAGAQVTVVAATGTHIQCMNGFEKGDPAHADATLADVRASMFDGLVLPGGMVNADRLRTISPAVLFVHFFAQEGKPIAVTSYAAWMLIEIDAVRGRLMTAPPSIRQELKNAGALYQDRPVVLDAPIISCRGGADLPEFCRDMVAFFEDPAAPQAAAYDPRTLEAEYALEFKRVFPDKAGAAAH
jgi:protease I